jgi:hypothetical protein
MRVANICDPNTREQVKVFSPALVHYNTPVCARNLDSHGFRRGLTHEAEKVVT